MSGMRRGDGGSESSGLHERGGMWGTGNGVGIGGGGRGNPLAKPAALPPYDPFADALFAWNRWKGHW